MPPSAAILLRGMACYRSFSVICLLCEGTQEIWENLSEVEDNERTVSQARIGVLSPVVFRCVGIQNFMLQEVPPGTHCSRYRSCENFANHRRAPEWTQHFFYTGVANQLEQRDSPFPAPSTPSTRGRPTCGCPRHLGGEPTAAKLTSSKALCLHRLRGSRGLPRLHGLPLPRCMLPNLGGPERASTGGSG